MVPLQEAFQLPEAHACASTAPPAEADDIAIKNGLNFAPTCPWR